MQVAVRTLQEEENRDSGPLLQSGELPPLGVEGPCIINYSEYFGADLWCTNLFTIGGGGILLPGNI